MDRSETPATYRTSKFQRGLFLLSIGALLLLAVLEGTDEGPILDLSLVNGVLTGATLLAVASYGLRATIRFEDIRRLHLPVTTEALWLYTDPSGSPVLTVEAQSFERFGALARQVLRRLPPGAEIRDPAGRIEGYRRGGSS